MNRNLLKLYLVTDPRFVFGADTPPAGESGQHGRRLEEIVAEAVRGGVTMVQLREKHLDTRSFIEEAITLKSMLKEYGVPLIINDRLDVALASDADGVHIGQSDMPYDIARKLMGPGKIIGLSVENIQQVEEANLLDVDYIGVSPLFSTPTKSDTAAPFGLEGLRSSVQLSRHPVVAIGGINADNASEVFAAGADGIAVVSALMGAGAPRQAASLLLQAAERGDAEPDEL